MKPLDEFPPVRRGEDRRQSWCRDCFAAYGRDYYRRNREVQKARLWRKTQTRRTDNRRAVKDYLRSHPCVDCGEHDIVVLQFDHLRDKRFDVSTMINSGATWSAIAQEIAKCEVRCANCHRLKTRLRYTERAVSRPAASTPADQLLLDDVETRKCRVCGEVKPLVCFPFRSRAERTRHSICLGCQREVARAWYLRKVPNARRSSGYGIKIRQQLAANVDSYLASHPCVDCGETNIILLDFDHLRDKIDDVGSMVVEARPWEEILAEIAKCEVRCANCHARATARRIGAYRLAAGR